MRFVGAGHEVMTLQHLDVEDITSVELLHSPPLISRADPHNFPFFDDAFYFGFTVRFDEALFLARFAAEIERVVKNGVLFLLGSVRPMT